MQSHREGKSLSQAGTDLCAENLRSVSPCGCGLRGTKQPCAGKTAQESGAPGPADPDRVRLSLVPEPRSRVGRGSWLLRTFLCQSRSPAGSPRRRYRRADGREGRCGCEGGPAECGFQGAAPPATPSPSLVRSSRPVFTSSLILKCFQSFLLLCTVLANRTPHTV